MISVEDYKGYRIVVCFDPVLAIQIGFTAQFSIYKVLEVNEKTKRPTNSDLVYSGVSESENEAFESARAYIDQL
ncbi:hypothetical protein bcgnr5372_48720 [Bacillus luti]